MLEPIGVAKVYTRDEDLNANRFIDRKYIQLFCREWGLTPKSPKMLLECEKAIDKTIDEFLIENPTPDIQPLAINGLVPLDGWEYLKYRDIKQVEGYLLFNEALRKTLYGKLEDNYQSFDLLTKRGNIINIAGKIHENPKIVITEGSGDLEEGSCVWFSDRALRYIELVRRLKSI